MVDNPKGIYIRGSHTGSNFKHDPGPEDINRSHDKPHATLTTFEVEKVTPSMQTIRYHLDGVDATIRGEHMFLPPLSNAHVDSKADGQSSEPTLTTSHA